MLFWLFIDIGSVRVHDIVVIVVDRVIVIVLVIAIVIVLVLVPAIILGFVFFHVEITLVR